MKQIRIVTPLTEIASRALRVGEEVLLSGVVYVARDEAHRRITEALGRGEPPSFNMEGAVIFYAGPSPARPGKPVGAIGPTPSYRMDPYSPLLIGMGVRGMIGKGARSPEVVASMVEHGAVYFGATGGIAALLASAVVASRVICYEDLGPEALRELEVRDMPLIVVIDSTGGSIYRKWP